MALTRRLGRLVDGGRSILLITKKGPVLKVFNNIFAANLKNNGKPAGAPGRIALLVAGGDAAAKQQAMALVEELGFDAVDGGSLHES